MNAQRGCLRAARCLYSALLLAFLVSASPVEAVRPAATQNTFVSTNLNMAWRSITTGAPSGRAGHTAVWTGSEMIVWGGGNLNDGASYNPATDSWMQLPTDGAPPGRSYHTAVWTGSQMIVWGGQDSYYHVRNDGGRLVDTFPVYLPLC